MASFISSLLLVILILANGCFTLPVGDEQSSSSTLSSFNDDLTTEKVFNLSLVSDDEKTTVPNIEPKQPVDEHAEFEISTSTDNLLAEKAFQASRTYDQFSTSEPLTSTIQDSFTDKRVQNEFLLTTVESITETVEHALRSINNDSENEVESEAGKGQYDHSLSNKHQPTGQGGEFESENRETNSEERHSKRDKQVELTTSFTPSFTSTSSAVAPELYTSESSTSTSSSTPSSTSTKKYIGLLTDEEQQQPKKPIRTQIRRKSQKKFTTTRKPKLESEDQPEEDFNESPSKLTTPKKSKLQTEVQPEEDFNESSSKFTTPRKSKLQTEDQPEEDINESSSKFTTPSKSKLQSEDQPEEDSKEPFIPIAVYQQDTLKNVVNVPNDFLILEENDGMIVTDFPSKLSQVTTESPAQPKPLNQGKKSTQPEEKKSDN